MLYASILKIKRGAWLHERTGGRMNEQRSLSPIRRLIVAPAPAAAAAAVAAAAAAALCLRAACSALHNLEWNI